MDGQLEPGQELYSVAAGRLSLFRSGRAVRLLKGMDGFVGCHIVPDGRTLWLYDSHNHAKVARNVAVDSGIQCGDNITRFVVAPDGVPEVDAEWVRSKGTRKGL